MKMKWYLQTWFIALIFALWPAYGIPCVIALILMYFQYKDIKKLYEKYGEVEAVDKYINDKKLEAINIFNKAKNDSEEIIKKANKEANDLKTTKQTLINELNDTIDSLKSQEKSLKKEITELDKEVIIQSANLSDYDNLTSEECKDKFAILRMKQSESIKEGAALTITSEDTKKILNNNIKQILRCFNSECKSIIENVSFKNLETSRGKIQKSFEILNNIFSTDGVAISYEFLEMKLEELNLLYSYALKKEEERETQKAIREQLIEEEKVRKEIEREKIKIEKEENQFKNEVSKLMKYMQNSKNDIEKNLYIEKIKELEDKLKKLETDKENVLQREQNTRAGFVYVISNIGSFGEDVYKIGMTRRLEPMDRIKELSDASVPFPFDVHAMIFSEDAPALENTLHQTFKTSEVNKVNSRKEFFKASLNEIKNVVLENYNATVDFTMIPEAEEYRESVKIAEAG